MASMSEAKKRANKKWNDDNLKELYDRIQLVVPKGQKQVINDAAKAARESTSEYIRKAIEQRMERERQRGVVSISGDEEISPEAWSCIVSVTEQKK